MIYFIPTPIGNLEDITIRAKRILSESSIVICEDARVIARLFTLLELTNKPKFITMLKHQEYNYNQIESILKLAIADETCTISVVSDAGTPGISDPGYLVIKRLQELTISYTVLPGATALIPAVVASGLVSKDFLFIGFLPLKKGRKSTINLVSKSLVPVVVYESSHRIKKLLVELKDSLAPLSQVFIAREISKRFEEYSLVNAEDLLSLRLIEKGEFAVIIKPQPAA
jgi:16S rRNA (cytidine1402-2'-O)-methyltransferase